MGGGTLKEVVTIGGGRSCCVGDEAADVGLERDAVGDALDGCGVVVAVVVVVFVVVVAVVGDVEPERSVRAE